MYVGYYKLGFIHNLIFAGAIMLPLASALSERDIKDVAAYFAAQEGSLYTIEYKD